MFYLGTATDYLRPSEGIYISSIESDTTSGVKTKAILPSILAPVPRVGDESQAQALYVPKGKALWATLQLVTSNNTADTPIIGAQGGFY